MEHGITWLAFIPGYQQLEAYLQSRSHGILMGEKLVIQHVVAALLVALIAILVGLRTRADLLRMGAQAVVPSPHISLRNMLEVMLEALYKQMHEVIGTQSDRYFPVLATFTLFILISNLLGLIPGMSPPTDNWNTTFACGIYMFFYYNWHGLRLHGFKHLSHMANPIGAWWGWFLAPLMFPIEMISHASRPLSLGIRLAANMMGDHTLLLGFLGLVPILVPLPFMLLGLVVSLIQTLVFVLLSVIYIGLAAGSADADNHA